jgi:hypothetical protein
MYLNRLKLILIYEGGEHFVTLVEVWTGRKRKLMQYLVFFLSVILSIVTAYGDESAKAPNRSNLGKEDLHGFVRSLTSEDISDEFKTDLNGDERPEYLLGVLCGNGGCQ